MVLVGGYRREMIKINEPLKNYIPLLPVSVVTIYAMIHLPTNLYDKMRIWFHEIGYVSVVVVGLLFIFYYLKLGGNNILMRTILTGTVVFSALTHYEIWWNVGWVFHRSIVILEVAGFIVCHITLLMTFGVLKKVYKIPTPQVDLFWWVVVSGVMILSIVWLNTTNFYQGWTAHYLYGENVNPHNIQWVIGKTVSLLSWMGVMKVC